MKRMLCALLVLSGVSLTPAWAADEQVCNSMGAACVCSHTFQTEVIKIAHAGGPNSGADWVHETDMAGKRCGEITLNGLPTYAATNDDPIVGGASSKYTFQTNAPGLPAGRNALQLNNPAFMGTKMIAGVNGVETMTGRIGIRQYVYYSPDYQSANYGSGTCTNDKQFRIGDYISASAAGMAHSSIPTTFPPGPQQLRGKWVKMELYVNNHQAPTAYDFYWRNITDNGPEFHQTYPARIGASTDPTHYPANRQPWIIDGYREGNCEGYRRYAYVMLAHWTTNTGQRIPSAVEIEGSGSLPPPDTAPPNPPLGLRISSLWDWMLTLLEKNG